MVSIIIPMYNVEKIIKRTIDCILEQDLIEFEVIIIDDCSKDNSFDVCNNYIKERNISNFFLYKNEKNSGPSYTRNQGIKYSKGKYIVFLDSDDYYEPQTLSKMLNVMKEQLLVMVGIKYLRKGTERNIINSTEKSIQFIDKREMISTYLNGLLNQPSNKMYDKKIIVENNIKFNEKSSYGEDLEFNLEYLKYVNKIAIINKPLYIYNETSTGLNSTFKENELDIDKANFEFKMKFFMKEFDLSENDIHELYTRQVRERIRLYYRYNKFSNNIDKNDYLNSVIKNDDINQLIAKSKIKGISAFILKKLIKYKLLFLARVYLKLFY